MAAPSAHAESLEELKLKSAFIYNFTKFVKWPESTFASATAPLTICAIGDDDLRDTLEETIRDKKAVAHPITLRRCKPGADLKNCQILFVQARELPKAAPWLSTITQPGLLTISEISGLDGAHTHAAMITLVPDDNRIRFAISNKLAEKASIEISSKLLSLAVSVEK